MASSTPLKNLKRVYLVTTKNRGQTYKPELKGSFSCGIRQTKYLTVYPSISSALMGKADHIRERGTNQVFVYALDCQKAMEEGVKFLSSRFVIEHRVSPIAHVTKELWITTPAKFTKIAELDCPHVLDPEFYIRLKAETGFDNEHYCIPLRGREAAIKKFREQYPLSEKIYNFKQFHTKVRLEFYKVKKWAIDKKTLRDAISQEDALFVRSLFPWITSAKTNSEPYDIPLSGKYHFLLKSIHHIQPSTKQHTRTIDPYLYPILGGTSFDRTAYLIKCLGEQVETLGLCITTISPSNKEDPRLTLTMRSELIVKTEEGYVFNNRAHKTLDDALACAQIKYKKSRIDIYRPSSEEISITYRQLLDMLTPHKVKNYRVCYE